MGGEKGRERVIQKEKSRRKRGVRMAMRRRNEKE